MTHPEARALAHGRKRPVKVVQHPTFRARPRRAETSSFRLPVSMRVVVLNERTAQDRRAYSPLFRAKAA